MTIQTQTEPARTRPSRPGNRPALLRFAAAALALLVARPHPAHAADRQLVDAGWRFQLGDPEGASRPGFDDTGWRAVELPHDWSIEGRVDPAAPTEGGGGFFPSGIGWYRRRFDAPASWSGRRVRIEFEGVCANASVWFNGVLLETHPYAYTSFFVDLTPYVNAGRSNLIAVRVDDSWQPSSRWYTGCGIYRHVWLETSDPIHLVPWSVSVSTASATAETAAVRVSAAVRNESGAPSSVTLDIRLVDRDGKTAAETSVPTVSGESGELTASASLAVPRPRLWSPEAPALYRAVVQVLAAGRIRDAAGVSFGIRTVRVSASRGLELNGRPIRLIGGSVHHDNGPLGSAAFDRAEERRVDLLKKAGFNAIRTSHNPPSPAFLAACDRLGMLVIDEAFDCWAKSKVAHDYGEAFGENWRRDLDSMVLRDRNHPSIVFWSIGNEVYERGTPQGFDLARELAARIRELDPTRPVTAGVNGFHGAASWTSVDPFFAALDVAGYNYQTREAEADHARLPSRVIVATESFQSEAFANWSLVQEHPYIIGDFVWSALDYLGEAGIGRVFAPGEKITKHWEAVQYPWHGAACGDVDITGWRKPASHYRAIVWDRGERLYAAVRVPSPDGRPWGLSPWSVEPEIPGWTWPGQEGKNLTVDVFSRYDSVRLFLNGRLLGEKPTGRAEQFEASFNVPFASGLLKAVGIRGGREAETFTLTTAGPAASVRLTPDRAVLRADGQDLAFMTIEVTDSAGVLRPDADVPVRIAIRGPGTIAGIGSGDMTSPEPYFANPRRVYQGRSLVVIRTTHEAGPIELAASAPGLGSARVALSSVAIP